MRTPPSAGPAICATLPRNAVERRRGGEVLARHEPRQHRVERRPLQAAGRRHPGRDEEQHPDVRLVEQRVGEQHERERQQRRVGEQHEPAPVVRVRQRAADQRGDQQRHQLGEPEQADDERRARQVVDLERDRDVRDHRARERDRLPDEEQPEVAVPAQGPDVERGVRIRRPSADMRRRAYEPRAAAGPLSAARARPGRRVGPAPVSRKATADVWWRNAARLLPGPSRRSSRRRRRRRSATWPACCERLDYLAGMGISCVWLMPFYPSRQRDDGYDITDFYGVDGRLGTHGDLVEMIRTARDRGIRVIADLVPNHTSDQHPWFRAAREGSGNPFHDSRRRGRREPRARRCRRPGRDRRSPGPAAAPGSSPGSPRKRRAPVVAAAIAPAPAVRSAGGPRPRPARAVRLLVRAGSASRRGPPASGSVPRWRSSSIPRPGRHAGRDRLEVAPATVVERRRPRDAAAAIARTVSSSARLPCSIESTPVSSSSRGRRGP